MRHFDPEEPAVAVRDDLARIALQIELRARPSRVFQALLAPDDLCHWFCPDVRTAPFRGGSFLFWGDLSVASLYAEGEGGGPIYGLEPATSLWYCWPIAGETTTSISLRISRGMRWAIASASRPARSGFISTRAHWR